MSSIFGRSFRVATFGESHGPAIGCVIDGCPPGVAISTGAIQAELDRRRPGASDLSTPRKEADRAEILSGVFEGRSTGTPIALLIRNQDARPGAYAAFQDVWRPSHADYAYDAKYGRRDHRGGGRASARETAARVAAGAIARALLGEIAPELAIHAWVAAVGDVAAPDPDPLTISRAEIDAHPTRCPDPSAAASMEAAIRAARADGDSLGGIVGCIARGAPAGWGDPVFAKLEADLAGAMLSIPAAKGFEIGGGFALARMRGSEANDRFIDKGGAIGTATNHSGGIQGGISNGEPIVLRVAFKPTATIAKPQRTLARDGSEVELRGHGRHDPCVLPRAAPIVEAMMALALADAALRQRALEGMGKPTRRIAPKSS